MKIPMKAPCPRCGSARKAVAGSDLRQARRKAGLTLQQLCARFDPPLSQSYLSELESGKKPVTAAVLALYESLEARRG